MEPISDAELSPGVIVDDRYTIVRLVGNGGMGKVYEAIENELGRTVALKVLHYSTLLDSDSMLRFEREGRLLATIKHPNILLFYRFGLWHRNLPYIAMEFLAGTSLLDMISTSEEVSIERSLNIIMQTTMGMSAAHQAGVIHRDLKPGNIMLVQQNPDQVKIIDFGLARMLNPTGEQSQHLTQTGALIGSIRYMSPEQCSGRAADTRSDIYALGCVLYELLTGAPPLIADNPIGLMHKHLSEQPAAVSKINRAVPHGTDFVLEKALAKEPANRYQTMDEFRADLELIASGQGHTIQAGAHSAQSSRKKLSRPVIAWCLIGGFGCVAAAALCSKQLAKDDTVFAVSPSQITGGKGFGMGRNHKMRFCLDSLSPSKFQLAEELAADHSKERARRTESVGSAYSLCATKHTLPKAGSQ